MKALQLVVRKGEYPHARRVQKKVWINQMRFLVYLARWQASGVVLAPCIALIPNSPIYSAITANLIGACVFYWIDKYIFKKG
jgi:hypothetical protein